MALGLNGRWGQRTENDPARQVQRIANPQSLASTIHYQMGKSAEEVRSMDPESWSSIAGDSPVSQEDVSDYLRAYEHYT